MSVLVTSSPRIAAPAVSAASHPYAVLDAAVRHALTRDLERLADALTEPITDVRRSALAQHIGFLLDQMQAHHRVQDEVIWPRVEVERADLAATADRVRRSHADLVEPSRDLRRAAQSWSSVRTLRPDVVEAALTLRDRARPVLDSDADSVPIACKVLPTADWVDIRRRLAWPTGPTARARRLFWLLDDTDPALVSLVLARTPRSVLWVLRNGFSGGYNRAAYLMWVGGGAGPAV